MAKGGCYQSRFIDEDLKNRASWAAEDATTLRVSLSADRQAQSTEKFLNPCLPETVKQFARMFGR
jgi:hypothetical protein